MIKGSDSQDRWSNASISVDDSETYLTLLRLGRGDWVNLSCNYDSFRYVEDYEEKDDKAYAVIHLSDCIDLK